MVIARAARLIADRPSHGTLAAELTNHLTDEVVLTSGMVATIPELQPVGFRYQA